MQVATDSAACTSCAHPAPGHRLGVDHRPCLCPSAIPKGARTGRFALEVMRSANACLPVAVSSGFQMGRWVGTVGNEITRLLAQARSGKPEQLSAVFESLYPELRRLAASRLNGGEQTLSPTTLVHELYLRATTGEPLSATDRRHFFVTAAKAMRWIVVDHARHKGSEKRGGGLVAVTLTGAVAVSPAVEPQVLALHEGLEMLGEINPQQREVVELHYFAGLEFAEIAELLGCSKRTVYREWERARAFLHAQLKD